MTLSRLQAYDAWADQRITDSLATLPPGDHPAVARLVAHLAGAKEIWCARLSAAEHPPTDRFPALSIPDAIQRLQAVNQRLAALPPRDLATVIAYRDTQGNPHQNTLGDILTHLVNHATYHRGQLATALKQAGGTPAVTDFIAFARV